MKHNRDYLGIQWFVIVLVIVSALLAVLTVVGVMPLEAEVQAAIVNGEVISEQELLETYDQLPAEYKEQFSEQDVLSQLIDKELILQEAGARGIVVSQDQVASFIDEQVAAYGISRQQLARTLEQGGLSIEEYEQAVYEELVLRAFIDEVVLSELEGVNESEQAALGGAAVEQLIAELREDATISYAPQYQA